MLALPWHLFTLQGDVYVNDAGTEMSASRIYTGQI